MLEEYEKLREFFAIQYERRRRESTARNLVGTLSTREREILTCMLDFGTSKEIARHLGISPRTVETHKANLMARLQVKTSTEAIRVAMEGGVFPIRVDDLPVAEESVGLAAAPPTMVQGPAPDPEPRTAASGR